MFLTMRTCCPASIVTTSPAKQVISAWPVISVTSVSESLMASTQPDVPRMPSTIVEVRISKLSSDSNGLDTSKNIFPLFTAISSFFPSWLITAALLSAIVTALASSRRIPARLCSSVEIPQPLYSLIRFRNASFAPPWSVSVTFPSVCIRRMEEACTDSLSLPSASAKTLKKHKRTIIIRIDLNLSISTSPLLFAL